MPAAGSVRRRRSGSDGVISRYRTSRGEPPARRQRLNREGRQAHTCRESESEESRLATIAQEPERVPAEVACTLCLDLWLDVVATPCGHRFCRLCLGRALSRSGPRCPLCRADLEDFDVATVPTDATGLALIYAAMPVSAIEKREEDHAEILEVAVGNRYEYVPQGVGSRSNIHKWSMYICVPSLDQRLAAHHLIDRVEYLLHPTFHPNLIVKHGPDFEFSAYGWGTFIVQCTIFWRISLPVTKIDHLLKFEPAGGRTQGEVDLDRTQVTELYRLLQ